MSDFYASQPPSLDFHSSDRANARAGVDSLEAFNAEVKRILEGVGYAIVDNPNYFDQKDIDAGGFADPDARQPDTNPQVTRYNPTDVQNAAAEISQIAEEMGVNLYTVDGNKPYFYNTGIAELNDVLYGRANRGDNAMSRTPGTFESPIDSMGFGDYVKQVLPNLAIGLAAGPFVSWALGAIPGLGGLVAGQNFAAAGIKGALADAVVQGVTTGEINLGDALKSGAFASAGYIASDFMKDVLAYSKPETAQTLMAQELQAAGVEDFANMTEAQRLQVAADFSNRVGVDMTTANKFIDYGLGETRFADLGGLLGPDGFLSQVTGTNFADLNVEGLQNAVDNVLGIIPEGVVDALLGEGPDWQSLSEQDKVAALLGQYDERFFDVMSPRGQSDLQGIWNLDDVQEGLSSAAQLSNGGALANALRFGMEAGGGALPAATNSVDWGRVVEAFNSVEGPEFNYELPDIEFTDPAEDTVNAADPDIEDPFEDTTQTPDPMVPQDPIVSSPTDPIWGQIDYGPQDGPFEPSSVTSPWSNLRDQMEGGSPGFAVKGEPNQQFWGTEYHMIADLSRMDNEGITEAEREFARQDWDRRIAEGEDPSTWDGGTNGANRENWVLHGWRNNDELRSAIQESGFDNNGQLPPGGQPGGELPPPGGSTDLPPGGSDLPPSGSPLPSAAGLLGTPQGAGTPMPMPGVPNANFVISPKVDIRATDMLAGLLSRYI
jgi:hypothetical protein